MKYMRNAPLVGGKIRLTRDVMPVLNPYDDTIIGEVGRSDERVVEEAIAAAISGFQLSKTLPRHERARVLRKASEFILSRENEIAQVLTLEVGKTINEAHGEVKRCADTLLLSSEAAKKLAGREVPFDASEAGRRKWGFFTRVPAGPVVSIVPFNFPLNLAAHKVGPAIAAGCSIIIKPASKTPFSAFILAESLLEAGLPPEVISVITGPGSSVGEMLVRSEGVRVITFTGSAAVGKRISRLAGLKRLTMELGSNSGVLILDDADIPLAVSKIRKGAFALAGQVCISVQRVYVQRGVYQRFLDEFVPRVESIRMGNPMLQTTEMGPIIDKANVSRITKLVEQAISAGGKIVTGGHPRGNFFEPTVITNVKEDLPIVRDELFAPVVVVNPVDSFEEGVSRLADSRYGLQAGIFTKNIELAREAFDRIEAGGIWVNEVPTFRTDLMPYGGVKDSGIGREGPEYAIEAMTEIKLFGVNRLGEHRRG
ncbi:aldehyde dehydrogenase family protein [bacterium]|nr:aldehyde dehydrogenase family protein [bacterium]